MSVGVVLVLLTIFSVDAFSKNVQANTWRTELARVAECQRLSETLAAQSLSHHWSQIDIELANDGLARNNELHVGSIYCTYVGVPLDTNWSAGRLRILRTPMTLEAQNV